MLRLSLLEFFVRIIPESFLLILAAYLISFKCIDKKRYILSSILLAISTYLVRLLPINYGINTLINTPIYILLCVLINRIPITKAITSLLAGTILLSMCEYINMLVIQVVLKKDVTAILNDQSARGLYFMPYPALFALIILLFYMFVYKPKKGIE